MRPALRTALVGYGYAGKTFHAPLVASTPGLVLQVVASSDPAKVRQDWPHVHVESDPLAAVGRSDVDLVVIATPNDTHARLAEAALRAGKHVVVDKPFTLTLAEARALDTLARQQERLLSVFHNRRWDADFLTLRQLLATGRLGDVLCVESRFDRFRPEVRKRWREQAGLGGGLWYDLGPHLVDQALQLFGRPFTVTAAFCRQRPEAQIVDWFQVRLDYGRLQVLLSASMMVSGGVPRFAVHGSQGSWIKYGLDRQEDALKAGRRPGEDDWGDDPQAGHLCLPDTSERVPTPSIAGDYRRYYAGIYGAIVGYHANPVTAEEAIDVMEIIELAQVAAAEGRTLQLPLRGLP